VSSCECQLCGGMAVNMVVRSLPGKTKEQAFSIGYEIAEAITAMNPAPVKLKFEKVTGQKYHSDTTEEFPCRCTYLACF
jgi:hypothetical protein